MIAVITMLVAFPAGYYFSSRLAANTTYAIAICGRSSSRRCT